MRKVLAELAGAETTERGKEEVAKTRALVRKLTEGPTGEDIEQVEKIQRGHKSGEGLLKAAAMLLEERRYRAVVRLCHEVMFGNFGQELQNRALALRKEAEDTASASAGATEQA